MRETRDEVVMAEDTCSTVDLGSTLVEGDVNMNFDYAFAGAIGNH